MAPHRRCAAARHRTPRSEPAPASPAAPRGLATARPRRNVAGLPPKALCTTVWCMKTAVYSWRVSAERKAAIEQLARKQKRSVAQLIDQAVGQLLAQEAENDDDEQVQSKLRRAAARAIGQISGGDPQRASQVSSRLREKLRRKHAESF